MAPAADMKWSPDVMKESFYFSNMCPQHPQLNRRGWKNLEEKIRDWAVADSAIIIICGPIIDKPSKTIGKNKGGSARTILQSNPSLLLSNRLVASGSYSTTDRR